MSSCCSSLRGPLTCGVGRRMTRYAAAATSHDIKRGQLSLQKGGREYNRYLVRRASNSSSSPSYPRLKFISLDTLKPIRSEMKSKAFFSDPTRIVDHMCSSLAAQNPTLRYDASNKGEINQLAPSSPRFILSETIKLN